MTVQVLPYDTSDPGDTEGLQKALAACQPDRIRRLALVVKTEGSASVNDYSRQYALLSSSIAIVKFGGEALLDRSTLLFSTGSEGAITPFGYLFVDQREDEAAGVARPRADQALTMGGARSRRLLSREIGTVIHADLVATAVLEAAHDAGVKAEEVALAIVKTPVAGFDDNGTGNRRLPITSAFSKAVGALGAGVALGEIDRASVTPEAFNRDLSLIARRAMVFSGSEVDFIEVLVLANSREADGDLTITTGQLKDLLDADGLRRTLVDAGLRLDGLSLGDPDRLVALLVKVGLAPDGFLRGRRTTMQTSHLDVDVHLRMVTSGIVGSITGSTRAFISANTVHQAPPGGGICAAIVRRQ